MILAAIFILAAPASAPVVDETKVVDTAVVLEGKPAPFTGVVVREKRFVKLLNAELQVPALENRLAVEQRFSTSMEEMYKRKLEDAAKPPPWYQSPYFNLTIGIIVGGGIAAGAILGGAQLTKAVQR